MNSSGLLLPRLSDQPTAPRSAPILPEISQLPELQSGATTQHRVPLHSTLAQVTAVQPASSRSPGVLLEELQPSELFPHPNQGQVLP